MNTLKKVLEAHREFEHYRCTCGWRSAPGMDNDDYTDHVIEEFQKA